MGKRTFEVLYPSHHGDDWEDCDNIEAFDHEEAAEKWAEEDDQQGDYGIISSGESEEIFIRREGESDIKKFKVWAESCPHYNARELK